jgi:hypothetical protein
VAEAGVGRGTRPTGRGPGRLLVAVYGTFAVAASSRAGYQVATKLAEAPVAYLLSAVAAAVYVVATVALLRDLRRLALASIGFELAGVLGVGLWSVLDSDRFPDATVWSGFGQGYGFVPLVLPVVGLLWLRRTAA